MRWYLLLREQWPKFLTLACLFLLPWQMRYIFWQPIVGTTESEFGVISVYVTMLLALGAAVGWRLVVRHIRHPGHRPGIHRFLMRWMPAYRTGRPDQVRHDACLPSAICCLFSLLIFFLTYPSPAHAWILNICFAIFLGYATYQAAKQDVRSVVIVLLASFIPVLLLGVWQMIAGWSPASTFFGLASRNAAHLGDAIITVHGDRILRMYGSFPHPNIFGVAIALVFGALATSSSRHKMAPSSLQITILITSILLVLFCISRSAALAMACASIAAYAVSRQHKKILLLAFLLPVLVWSLQFISPSILALRGQSFTEQQSIAERVEQMSTWWQVMYRDGLFGTGLYEYPQAVAQVQGASLPAWAYQPMHNVFLLILAEVGVVGCGVLGLGVWIFLCIKTTDGRRQTTDVSESHFSTLTIYHLPSTICYPLFTTLFSLALFDHALWTSWSGMAYTAVSFALVFAGGQSRISTLDQGVLDEIK